jgi:Flp pilus assembly protein TadD
MYVVDNPHIQDGISLETIKWAFTSNYAGNWHPLTWLSHTLDWQLFGNNAGGHHIVNLIFHIANTLILFIVLKQMTVALWQSAFVAALFALHPLHVESVAWVSERKDVLSTFFLFLTMWAYLKYVRKPKIWRYLPIVFLFALGLMAKPMLVTLPFVLLLLDYWPLERFGKQKFLYLVLEKVPLFALSAASSVVTFFVQRSNEAVVSLEAFSLKYRIFNAVVSYAGYIQKMVWPSRLAVFYPHSYQRISVLLTIISAAILLVITFFVIRYAKRYKYLLFGWFWYVGTLVPVIGIVQVGSQAMANRYTYITLTGLFVIVAWGTAETLKKWKYKKIVLTLSAVPIILILSICTYKQVGYWKNSLTLFQYALDVTEDNHIAHLHLAIALCKQNRLDAGVSEYKKYLQMRPDDADVRSDLGMILNQLGRFDEAVHEYKKYLQIKPNNPNVLNDIGVALSQQGKFEEAIEYLSKSLEIKPDFSPAHTNLGYILMLQRRYDEAEIHLAEAVRLEPDTALPHHYLGQIYSQKRKIDKAVQHFEQAIRIKNDWYEPINELAWYLAVSNNAEIRKSDRAVELAKRACELTNYSVAEILDTLAAAYAAAGEFDKAVETAEKAIELCRGPEKETLRKEIKSRLDLYKAGKEYVEPLLP